MSDRPLFTYQTRLVLRPDQEAALAAYAALYGKAERALFAAIRSGASPVKIKPAFTRRFGLTARQYNAICLNLQGKITSIKQRYPSLIAEMETRIAKARKVIAKLEKRTDGRPRFKLHNKKRRLRNLEIRLAALRADHQSGTVRLCFGSKRLFRAQFHLEANGYETHAEWKNAWQSARDNQFYVIGSKDETAGCQGCVASRDSDGTLSLRVRLPNTIGKYIILSRIRFAYGQNRIEASLAAGMSISYRFLRDDKSWRVFVSTEAMAPETVSKRLAGAVGIDINGDHIAVSETDHFGNLVKTQRITCNTRGLSQDQSKAAIGDAVKQIAEWAASRGKPVVLEKLDFIRRKAELEKTAPDKARMLSGFAYRKSGEMLRAACFRRGVEVIGINPAYTSVIGAVNYAQRHGISVHQGAALAAARRGMGLSERPTVREAIVPTRNGGHVTLALPARNRARHVWSFWSCVRTRLKAAHAAHVRSGGNKVPPVPLPRASRSSALGATWALPVQPRHANRHQHCSGGVLEDVPH